ncbi:hypothetical protein GCM10010910_14490 [Microbacterium nanhaiense]|uniref:Helix-turn-helix domain-containing protein n=2 Tax=Microbacterium nanhaiense TaxID=1301026 RepID=A0ABQ2N4T1_9MICO|nr:hypothetical protein GCM10010910_14490 [Microbacterium nanhaiense]
MTPEWAHNGTMSSVQGSLFLSSAQVAELLSITPEEVVSLIHEGRLRGTRLGEPASWRVEKQSVRDYLDDENEASRRHALWHQSNVASLPEIWGSNVTF